MKSNSTPRIILFLLFFGLIFLGFDLLRTAPVQAGDLGSRWIAQQPTLEIPTVTSSPGGAYIQVNGDQDQINVRTGPGTGYPTVGILTTNQRVPAIGRSPGGDWVEIIYPGVPDGVGWIYSYLVTVYGSLPVVELPSTPTPQVTATIDPTLAAQYIIEPQITRLPTFTPPQQLVVPTFIAQGPAQAAGGVPVGLVIVSLGVIGLFGLMVSILRGR
jgi:uncharacterized protein YraI